MVFLGRVVPDWFYGDIAFATPNQKDKCNVIRIVYNDTLMTHVDKGRFLNITPNVFNKLCKIKTCNRTNVSQNDTF